MTETYVAADRFRIGELIKADQGLSRRHDRVTTMFFHGFTKLSTYPKNLLPFALPYTIAGRVDAWTRGVGCQSDLNVVNSVCARHFQFFKIMEVGIRKTILLAVTLVGATLSVTIDHRISSVAGRAVISAATPTYATLFPRLRNRRRSVPEAAQPAAKPA